MADLLLHYSVNPIEHLCNRTYEQATYPKPKGFWLSVGEDWADWCKSVEWGLGGLRFRYEVKLCPDAKILRISTPEEIDRFTKQFGRPIGDHRPAWQDDNNHIDWVTVSTGYQGIIIAPYQWSRRLDMNSEWYYGWDCASGCIWDITAIESITAG